MRLLRLIGVPRGRMDELSGRLFGAGAVGLAEDWLPGRAPPPRQPWDADAPEAEPDPVVVSAWFEGPGEPAPWAADYAPEVVWEEVEERDWEAESRAAFAPLEVAPGLTLAPPWDAPSGALIIEPGSGFGTGHHPSTRTALRLLLRRPPPKTALDVGCGSGVLALAAARRGAAAWGIDVEASAIRDAERNAALNQLPARFSSTPLADVPGTYDLVLANLHAELILALRDALLARVGSALIVAGVLADREARVQAALAGELRCVDREVEDEWIASTWARTG